MKPQSSLYRCLTMAVLLASLLHLFTPTHVLARQDIPQPPTMQPDWAESDDTTSAETGLEGKPPEGNQPPHTAASDDTTMPTAVRTAFTYLPFVQNAHGCDELISPGSINFDGTGTPPGSILCLQSGTYGNVVFRDLRGTAESPITIMNHGGQVRVTGPELEIRNCQHVRLTGTGTPRLTYGIHADQAWVHVYEAPSYIEIDHIRVTDQRLSVADRTDPDHETTDIRIHHNYLHCSPGGYGYTVMYIGRANYQDHVNQYVMRRVEIDHNTFDGADGRALKVCSIVEDCKIHHNVVKDALRMPMRTLKEAVAIAEGATAEFFSNVVQGSPGYGVSVDDGYFSHHIYNNLIIDTGQGDQYQDAFITWHGDTHVFNNTIIGARRYGINLGTGQSGNEVYNNIVLDTAQDAISYRPEANASIHSNHTKLSGYTSANYGFVNPISGDYRLKDTCEGLDAGANSGIKQDLDGNPRPLGTGYDMGCYERNPNH